MTTLDQKLMNDVTPYEKTEELQVGHIVRGYVVSNLRNVSFVKVGSVSCILPRSEVSYEKKPKAPEVGKQIDAAVVRISDSQGVMLSVKRLTRDPWLNVNTKYHVGENLKCRVKSIVSFGAFIDLELGITALLHRSNMGIDKSTKVKDYISIDDELEVEITMIDVDNKRISLKCIPLELKG